MILYESLAIGVEQEAGGIYRAYAFNPQTEQNISTAKHPDRNVALVLLFSALRDDAIEATR